MNVPRLIDARLQLHWAAQIAAGVGRTLLPRRGDDSHTAFTFADGVLLQGEAGGMRAGLRLRDLALVCAPVEMVVNAERHSGLSTQDSALSGSEEFPLRGRTLDDGFAFLSARLGHELRRPDVELPDHPVAHGSTFDADAKSCERLGALYATAASLLRAFDGSPVLCWPHHFDIATLLTIREGTTIGVGLSPGDASYPEPYWYVTPYPYPDANALPPLTRGTWHTTEWVGAVLPALPAGEPRSFLAEAVARVRGLLG